MMFGMREREGGDVLEPGARPVMPGGRGLDSTGSLLIDGMEYAFHDDRQLKPLFP